MKPLPQNYDHKATEKKWQEYWEQNQVYSWKDDQPRDETFVIDTPPPTVSGVLHMGHIFSYAQADFVARYQRMIGKDVFYPMGFDDNGLPTERLVEKVKKVRATDMSREDFIKLCEDVTGEARKEFRHLFESVALSVDWKQEYHTISDESRKISQLSFLDLFYKDRAYRKLQPMLWDPVDQTAIAQAEVEDKELPSNMNYITFTVEDEIGNESPSSRTSRGEVRRGAETASQTNNTANCSPLHSPPPQVAGEGICSGIPAQITIATTRPELLGACVAVFYHPEDGRYKNLAGKTAITPLFGVKVPLLADENVKMEKGTGLVMCCTFGDETDIMWWRTHNLETRLVLNKYGKIQVALPLDESKKEIIFTGSNSFLDSSNTLNITKAIEVFSVIQNKKTSNPDPKSPGAREIIINLLKENNLLIKQESITHAVKCAERSGAALEILPTHQWFIKILDQKEQLKAKAAECNWHPDYMRIRINQWIDGLSWDWCISRQRYFGVPFPVWYSKKAGEEGKIILPDPSDLPVNPLVDLPKGYSRDEVIAEADVMDTWATSSISPQLSSKGINSVNPSPRTSRGEVRRGAATSSSPDFIKWKNSEEVIARAKELRKNLTDAEEALWSFLRRRQIRGNKFRKQYPIGKYYADFACIEQGLIIELDGGQHAESENQKKDQERTEYLAKEGFEVIRFWNTEVLQNIEGVLEAIWNRLPDVDGRKSLSVAAPLLTSPREERGEGLHGSFVLNEARHKKLFPADLRPQAHEIIRTWAFYTIVKAHLHEDQIPWKNLMISGWCLASDKTKMSKSKGNVITPVDLIEEKGADVVRFWASTSRLGCDTAFSEDVLKIGRKLTTKLWNATKFAAIHLDKIQQKPLTAIEDVKNGVITEPLDLWILARLRKAIDKATQEFDKFEYCDARVAAEDFFWNDFCDNYLELVKGRVYGEEGGDKNASASQLSAVYTIYHCLDGILRLFAPIVPHVTDELYTHIFDDKVKAGGSIHARGNWPDYKDYPENTDAENAGIAAVGVLNAVRKLKAERNVSIKWPLNFISITGDNAKAQLEGFAADLKNVTSASEIVFVSKQAEEAQGLTTRTEDGKFEVTAEFASQASNSDAA